MDWSCNRYSILFRTGADKSSGFCPHFAYTDAISVLFPANIAFRS